ncbi:FAD binding domain-containing protein [Actinokineospora cianjurensis]|uniref:Xanthine dehydrogenase YagS FAD-binding subunit n=1 Tax=Actinokineospora cianjurensis TaxID=585224 RepID=A0A421B137_9PSEU|nr:xanthine dehydrogenase family protein subunit M [Actinokineospora cianjurensis]RLK58105.1 xanthine dehydrogenase YagS FAD-binding subunit [Actinokineospora cianjurensis]
MRPFDHQTPENAHTAVHLAAAHPTAAFLAGGTNLVDHLKLGITHPDLLIDLSTATTTEITEVDGGLLIGAGARNSDIAADHRVRTRYPALAEALLSGASGQLRNMATAGGNPLQRTRCAYFQDTTTPCNKRRPGSGCAALGGFTRGHAILGASDHCVATHPSDMAVALTALDATVHVLSPDGERTIPFVDLHRLPDDDPTRDTVLDHGDLITTIELPDSPIARQSRYRKVRDRASYAFALVSVAAALEVTHGVITDARLAFGGVAHKPWRAHAAEQILIGEPATDDTYRLAAETELADARTLDGLDGGNAFKVPLLIRTTTAVLRQLAEEPR